jgi:hypothetical protein
MATRHVFWKHLGTPSAIYGTVVYASLIAAAGFHGGSDDVQGVFLFSIVTLVTFWMAHVFAEGLAHQGSEKDGAVGDWASVKHALLASVGMLEAAILPSIPLALGSLGILKSRLAVQLSLGTSVFVLFALGILAFSTGTRPLWARVTWAIVTALFGVAIIIVEATVH